jgi:hypothetical protein
MHGEIIHHALQREFPPCGILPKWWLKITSAFYYLGPDDFFALM